MEGERYAVSTLGRPRLELDMGVQWGDNSRYLDAVATVTWLGKANRSPSDIELLIGAAKLRRLEFEVAFPEQTPPPLDWRFAWAVYANDRIVRWDGGQADKP